MIEKILEDVFDGVLKSAEAASAELRLRTKEHADGVSLDSLYFRLMMRKKRYERLVRNAAPDFLLVDELELIDKAKADLRARMTIIRDVAAGRGMEKHLS